MAIEVEMTWASALDRHKQIAANMLLYLIVHKACGRQRAHGVRLRPLYPDSGTASIQAPMGLARRAALWYDWSRGDPAKTPSPDDASVQLGASRVEATPGRSDDRIGAAHREVHSRSGLTSIRRQPPVSSPIEADAALVAAAVAAGRRRRRGANRQPRSSRCGMCSPGDSTHARSPSPSSGTLRPSRSRSRS